MTRRMSCSMTIDAVRDQTKTVTRRHEDTWQDLQPGDHLTLVEKAMGLPKGAKQVVLAEVCVVSVRVEPITNITPADLEREGFDPDEWTTEAWALWWAQSHGYNHPEDALHLIECRRIEWFYVS